MYDCCCEPVSGNEVWTGLTLGSAQALNHGNAVTEHTFHSKVKIFYKSTFPKIKTQ
jgi:hypothetical protein